MWRSRRFRFAAVALLVAGSQLRMASPVAGFSYRPSPLHVLIAGGELIVLAAVDQVPDEKPENRGQTEIATLKVETLFKGPEGLKEVKLSFARGMGTLGIFGPPLKGHRAVWILRKAGEGVYSVPRPDYVRGVSEEELRCIKKILETEKQIAAGKPPAEQEIRDLLKDPASHLNIYAVHLMGRCEPIRYLDFFKSSLLEGKLYMGVLAEAIAALPPDKAVPLLLEVIGEQKGSYERGAEGETPLAILHTLSSKGNLNEELQAKIRASLIARYAREGEKTRTTSQGDALIGVLALVADRSCVPTLQKALIYGEGPGTEGTVDDSAARGLWKALGAEALPLLRPHLSPSHGSIEKLLGEHGDAADFARLLAKLYPKYPRLNSDLFHALIRMVERAGLKPEPWMKVNQIPMPEGTLEQFDRWWASHRATFKLRGTGGAGVPQSSEGDALSPDAMVLQEWLALSSAGEAAPRMRSFADLSSMGKELWRRLGPDEQKVWAPKILAALRQGLKSDDWELKRSAAQASGFEPALTAPLAEDLAALLAAIPQHTNQKSQSLCRYAVLESLVALGPHAAPAVDRVLRFMDGYRYSDHGTAYKVLEAVGPPALLPVLKQLQRNPAGNEAYGLGGVVSGIAGKMKAEELRKDAEVLTILRALAGAPAGPGAHAQKSAEAILRKLGEALPAGTGKKDDF